MEARAAGLVAVAEVGVRTVEATEKEAAVAVETMAVVVKEVVAEESLAELLAARKVGMGTAAVAEGAGMAAVAVVVAHRHRELHSLIYRGRSHPSLVTPARPSSYSMLGEQSLFWRR